MERLIESFLRYSENSDAGARRLISVVDTSDCCWKTFVNIKKLSDFPLKSKNIVLKRENTHHSNCLSLDDNTTDVTLIVNNRMINAHKDVLSSYSEYFNCMFNGGFKERNQDKIEINIADLSYENLKALIEYFYNSELLISEQNVQELLIGSRILLLENVGKTCVDYMKTLIDVENCISIKNIAITLCLFDLYSSSLSFMLNNFRLVAVQEAFMTLSYNEIMLLIKNDNLCAKEKMVYEVVTRWVKHDPLTRSKNFQELLLYVRFPFVSNIKFQEPQDATIVDCFPRKPFRKGILILSHNTYISTPEWYDAGLDRWRSCTRSPCYCKYYKTLLAPQLYLCSCTLLDDGRLFAVGGFQSEKGLTNANLFNPKTEIWTAAPNMCFPRVRPYVMEIGTKVYVIGGCLELDPHTSNIGHIEYYDLQYNVWHPVRYSFRGISFLRNDTFVTSVNGLIYIIGQDKAGFFNPHDRSWCPIPELPEKREDAAVCTLNNRIYIIGGHYQGNYLKSVWSYCTETYVWTALADMNSPRSYLGAAVMNGFVYVFGGKHDGNSYSNTFEMYHPYENEWKIPNDSMLKKCPSNLLNIDAIVVDEEFILYEKIIEYTWNDH